MFVTEIRNIPYFDGHCDTIYECMGKGRSLRENSGHVDLMRGQRYGRRAQFFCPVRQCEGAAGGHRVDEAVPDARLVLRAGGGKCRCDGSLQNRSGGGRCRRPTQDRRAAEHRGRRSAGLRHGASGDGGLMGRAAAEPGVEQRQRPVRLLRAGAGARPVGQGRGVCGADGGAGYTHRCLPHLRRGVLGRAAPGEAACDGVPPNSWSRGCAPTGGISPTTCSAPSGTPAAW